MSRILLVDDDEPLRKMLRQMLVTLGHVVVEAGNGREAVMRQHAEPAEIMLTDLIMPEMEGIETILDFQRTFPAVKIIAMSGGGRGNASDYLKIAKKMGAACTLDKPFSADALAAAIVVASQS